ncbi:MAG: FAD-binding oxidoreductase [Nanoarchaeota archaeon]
MQVKIKEIIQETKDTATWQFDGSMNYLPGQFITIDTKQFPQLKEAKVGRTNGPRAYSITWPFGITVKKEEQGLFSTFVLENYLNVGDVVEIKGPFGFFKYSEPSNVVLLGAGSGIVPLYTIICNILHNKIPVEAKLLYSNKTESDIIFKKQLDKLSSENKNIEVVHTLTRADDSWTGRKGRIDISLIESTAKDLSKFVFYICGPSEFGNSLKNELLKKGVSAEKIKMEAYG